MALKNLLTSLPYWNSWFKSGHKRKDGTVFVSELDFATPLMDLRLVIWWQSGSHQIKGQQDCQQLGETCEEQVGSRKKSSVTRVKFACAMQAEKQLCSGWWSCKGSFKNCGQHNKHCFSSFTESQNWSVPLIKTEILPIWGTLNNYFELLHGLLPLLT